MNRQAFDQRFHEHRYHTTHEAAFYDVKATTAGIDKKGRFRGTKLGINISAKINDRIMLASQLLATAEGNYALNIDGA